MSAPVRYRRLLVAVDFSHCADRALDHALAIARAFDAELVLLHALYFPPDLAHPDLAEAARALEVRARDAAARRLEKARQKAEAAGVKAETRLASAPPVDAIQSAAAEVGADLVVMGTHGWGVPGHLALGSTAERALRSAPCPVLVVRATDTEGRNP
jgi:nucleotide-binding universal stress UspA family protein